MANRQLDSLPFHATPTNANYWRSSKGGRNESKGMLRHASTQWHEDNYRHIGQQIPRRRLSSNAGGQLWATRRGDRGSDLLGNREKSRLRTSRSTSTRTL